MAEAVVEEGCPQVFVVDSRAASAMPIGRHPKRGGFRRRLQTALLGLALFGVIVEACFIYYLYNNRVNLPSTTASQPEGVILGHLGQVGPEVTIESPSESQGKPSAHLIIDPPHPVDENGVVQWIPNMGEAFQHGMSYNNSRLRVQRDGFYYIYSKVQLNSEKNCSPLKHMVMKETDAYGKALELMQDFRSDCMKNHKKNQKEEAPSSDHRLSSFLGAVFHLRDGDAIYVKLETQGTTNTDTFMGAFMI